jgi:hypothetical protein
VIVVVKSVECRQWQVDLELERKNDVGARDKKLRCRRRLQGKAVCWHCQIVGACQLKIGLPSDVTFTYCELPETK